MFDCVMFAAQMNNRIFVFRKNKLSPDSSPIPAKELACRLCSFRSTSSGDMQSHMSLAHKQDGFYKWVFVSIFLLLAWVVSSKRINYLGFGLF